MPPKPGEIYEAFFQYDDGTGGKYRPVLVVETDSGLFVAVAIKVTTSKPNAKYTHHIHKSRIEIKDWKTAGLRDPSWAQCSTFEVFKFVQLKKYIGRLTPDDFQNIHEEYLKYTS